MSQSAISGEYFADTFQLQAARSYAQRRKKKKNWKNEVVLIICFCHACAFSNNGVAFPQVRRCTDLSDDNTQRRDSTNTSALTSAYFVRVVLGLFLLRSCSSINLPDFLLLQVVSPFFFYLYIAML